MGCGDSKEKTSNKVSPKKTAKEVNNNSLTKFKEIDDGLASFYFKKPTEEIIPKEVEFTNVTNLEGHTNYVDVCCLNPKLDIFLSASSDRKAFLWHLEKKPTNKQILDVPDSESVSCADWSTDGTQLALGTEQGQVMVWSSNGELLASWYPCDLEVRSVKINGDLVGSAGSLVCVYSLSESVCQIFGWNKSLATYFEWMSESKFLVAESSGMISLDSANQQKMKKIDQITDESLENLEPRKRFDSHTGGVYKGHFGYVVDICWLNSDKLVSASYDGSVKLWNTSNGVCNFTLEAHHDHISSVNVSPNGKYIVSGGHDGIVNVWPTNGTNLINSLEGSGRILSCCFNHSGNKLIASSYGNIIVSDIEIHENNEQKYDDGKKQLKKEKQHVKSKKK